MNHGYNNLGNEAGFFGYTKELAENYEKLKLDDKIVSLYDFSTLVPQIMENEVIPLESTGVPYPYANDTLFYITSIKAKAQQLLKYIELFVKKYPKNKKVLEKHYNLLYNMFNADEKILIEEPENYLEKLRNFQKEIYDLIDKNNKNIFFTIVFYIIFILLGLIIAFDIYTLKKIILTNNHFFTILIIFGLYFPVLCVMLYPSDKIYEKIYTSVIYQYYSYAFILLFYNIFNFDKIKNNIYFFPIFTNILVLITFLSLIFYKYEIFTKLKKYFTKRIQAKLCDFIVFFPLFGFYMGKEIYKTKGFYFDKKYKYNTFKILTIMGIAILIFMIIFEIILPRNFEVHTIFSFIINFFVFLLLALFFASCFFKYYSKNENHSKELGSKDIVDGLPLVKLFLMLYHFF